MTHYANDYFDYDADKANARPRAGPAAAVSS